MGVAALTYDQIMALQQERESGQGKAPISEWMSQEPTSDEWRELEDQAKAPEGP